MRVLLDPAETGAVTIALHQDVQGEAYAYPVSFCERREWLVARRAAAPREIEAAANTLRAARRPMVVAGGGVRYSAAEDALRRLCEQLRLPAAETSAGKGALAGSEWLAGGLG